MINKLDKLYNDYNRSKEKNFLEKKNKYSKYCNLIYYKSSINPELTLAMLVIKPKKPSYILATTHGWHMSIPEFKSNTKPSEYLYIIVDMRGRKYSEGKPDCNGYELMDVIDACEYVKKHYSKYLINKEVIYFEGGSGGGGNAYEIANKFPDYFAHITALCGITDYALWYKNDKVGEFQDELKPWIGCTPEEDNESYASRSAIASISNLRTHLFMAHGETDIRVPCYHARNYFNKIKELGKTNLVNYFELPKTGGPDHWSYITKENEQRIIDKSEEGRKQNRIPVTLEKKGKLIIPGYLVTKYFDVFLKDIGKMATITYDIDKGIYNIDSKVEYTIKIK